MTAYSSWPTCVGEWTRPPSNDGKNTRNVFQTYIFRFTGTYSTTCFLVTCRETKIMRSVGPQTRDLRQVATSLFLPSWPTAWPLIFPSVQFVVRSAASVNGVETSRVESLVSDDLIYLSSFISAVSSSTIIITQSSHFLALRRAFHVQPILWFSSLFWLKPCFLLRQTGIMACCLISFSERRKNITGICVESIASTTRLEAFFTCCVVEFIYYLLLESSVCINFYDTSLWRFLQTIGTSGARTRESTYTVTLVLQ